MYCANCGKEIPGGAKYCPYCGTPASGFADLIRRAQGGDQAAVSILYEQTYNQVFYTVKSMVKDEDAVFDILQDSYIKAFSHLDSFTGGDRFPAWVRQIAANTARDWMKKKRPMLFSELEPDSDVDLPAEAWFEDENPEHLPDYVIDQNETSRLIREILDELPEDQRAAIGMYYYEEMSVKKIAAAMNATENAVKSRLLYGRRKIEKKVRELEKNGTKLYGLAPIPFLWWLLQGQKTYAAEIPDAGIRQVLLSHTASSTAAPSAGIVQTANVVGTAKAAGAGLSAAKITAAIVASVVVIGGGAFGISRIARRPQPVRPPAPPAIVSESSIVEEPAPEPEPAEIPEETIIESRPEVPEPESKPEPDITVPDIGEDSTPDEQDDETAWIEDEEAAGRTILTGTVETMTYDGAVELQGYPDYNAADKGQTWVILRLDSPQMLQGSQDVSTWEKEHSVVLIWTQRSSGAEYGESTLSEYIGKHIICSAGSFSKASDTSVPIGVPWAHDIHVPKKNE